MHDITEQQLLCPKKQRMRMYSSCIERCTSFPCLAISDKVLAELKASPFTEVKLSGFEQRRRTMFIGFTQDDKLVTLPPDFSPEKDADYVLTNRIVEVYQINKVYVPQVRLVVKHVEERKAIREAAVKENSEPQTEQPKKRRRK